jgi:glyoxylase-like metal-dependent hydrolase (beta-lactamase superfamily II)
LNDLLVDFPSVKIYTNDFGKRALSNPKLNMSVYHEDIPDFTINSGADIVTLNDHDDIIIGSGCKAFAISTQGHDKSCISYLIDKFLFSGDSYIPTAKLVASFPNSNKKEALRSYERLVIMSENYDLCPGHGPINKRKR